MVDRPAKHKRKKGRESGLLVAALSINISYRTKPTFDYAGN